VNNPHHQGAKNMQENLHPELAKVLKDAQGIKPVESNIVELQSVWEQYLNSLNTMVPDVCVLDSGEVVYLGKLSAGCQACKDGTWDCIFTTMRCNLACEFCYSPHAIKDDFIGSVFGSEPDQIAQKYEEIPIQGVSFSGGEPFLEKTRLFDWISYFTSNFPGKYYWVYTNGLLVTKKDIKYLGELGIDEIRFNLAATGYNNPLVMENISYALSYLPYVTIEIPSIPEHRRLVLENLVEWNRLGVHYLNLHELIYEPDTNSASMEGVRSTLVNTDGHYSQFNPQSRSLTLDVMQKATELGLAISVNDCSMQSKLRQLRNRRRNISTLELQSHEKFVREDRYETCCAYLGESLFFFHPDHLDKIRDSHSDHHLVRLTRIAPLSLQEQPKWVSFEILR
jgi:pyruvate formate-lyase activating enzyme-like uncharacterized protein